MIPAPPCPVPSLLKYIARPLSYCTYTPSSSFLSYSSRRTNKLYYLMSSTKYKLVPCPVWPVKIFKLIYLQEKCITKLKKSLPSRHICIFLSFNNWKRKYEIYSLATNNKTMFTVIKINTFKRNLTTVFALLVLNSRKNFS